MRRATLGLALTGALAFASMFAPGGSTTAALAQGLPDTLNMSCAQARAIVRQSGAVVLATGPRLYERYVTARSYCSPDQDTQPAWTETADNPQCQLGDRCVDAALDVR